MKVLADHLPKTKRSKAETIIKGTARALTRGADDVIDAVATIGVIADGTGGVSTKLASSLGKKAIASAAGKWLEQPSLQASYNTLVERLKKLDLRFVIIVDDIERLTSNEVRDLMTMVKTLGKLPNVIYLLSYDRSVVWGALKTIDPDPRAGAFAEKIVQHELELPMPHRSALLSMLSEALSFLELSSEPSERRSSLIRAGVVRWMRQPRDVMRLANAMRFAWGALAGEIDPDDLLCMEGLRLHDRELFEWIRDNREALIDDVMPHSDEERKRFAESFAEKFKGTRSNATELMLLLFPNRSDILRQEKFGMSGELWSSVRVRRGIATSAGYEAYFSLNPGVTTLSKAMVDEAVSAFGDQAKLETLLRIAINGRDEFGNTLIAAMLEELCSRIEQGTPATPTLLSTLIWLEAEIGEAPWNGDLITPRMQHYFLVTEILKRWSPEERMDHLTALYASEPPLASIASLHVDLARSLGLLPGGSDYLRHFVTREQLDYLGMTLVRRIERAREENTLNDQPAYYDIARVWAFHGDVEKPKAWISDAARSGAVQLARIALGLLGYSRNAKGRHYGMSEKPDGTLYDVDVLLEACLAHRDLSGLSVDEAARVKALTKGLQALQDSISSSQRESSFGGTDDEDGA